MKVFSQAFLFIESLKFTQIFFFKQYIKNQGVILSGQVQISCTYTSQSVNKTASAPRCVRSILKRSEKINNMQGMILTKPQFHFTNIVSSWHEEKILAVDTLKSFFRYEYLLSKSKYERLNSVKWFFVGSPSNSEQPKFS